eukprot:9170620-Alexandrium_andersonii.AAC.1
MKPFTHETTNKPTLRVNELRTDKQQSTNLVQPTLSAARIRIATSSLVTVSRRDLNSWDLWAFRRNQDQSWGPQRSLGIPGLSGPPR